MNSFYNDMTEYLHKVGFSNLRLTRGFYIRRLKKPKKKNDHNNVKRDYPTGIDFIGYKDYMW